MKKQIFSVFVLLVALSLPLTGCLDIGGSFKPGSFGKTPREQAMVEAIAEKYGDLSEKGDPQFLEARMTSRIEEFIPVDTVTKYSADAKKLYAWFVYDNFNNDEIEVEWIYLDDNYSIHTFKAKTGEDLGRGAFILEQPDDGWALGNYKVLIRGRGLTETLTFEIIEGATVAVSIPFENGKISLEEAKKAPGWYFTHWEYIIMSQDYSLVGVIKGSVIAKTGNIWDTYLGTGEKNNFKYEHKRTYDDGSLVGRGESTTKWTDPPDYFSGTDRVVITVDNESGGWDPGSFGIGFDSDIINPGGATSSKIYFEMPDGKTSLSETYKGTFQMQRASQGSPGQKKAIIVYLSGYGYKYYYEWRE